MGLILDFKNNTIRGYSGYCRDRTASDLGAAVDLNGGAGDCVAVEIIGTISGTFTAWSSKLQESDDLSTWTDVSGGTITASTSAPTADTATTVTFTRTKRYVRHWASIGGTSPHVMFTCLIAQATAESAGQGKRAGASGGRAG